MTIDYFRYEIVQYLTEQGIDYDLGEPLESLCRKAATCGYSFSDEMIEEFGEFILEG